MRYTCVGWLAWVLAVSLPQACIGDRPVTCRTSSDCESSFCADSGFCDRECREHIDCPCGSVCATSCGLCVRLDGRGPATCFALSRGLDTNEVLGACREHQLSQETLGEGGDTGTCDEEPPTLPVCLGSPPSEGETTTSTATSSGGAGGEGGDTSADQGESGAGASSGGER